MLAHQLSSENCDISASQSWMVYCTAPLALGGVASSPGEQADGKCAGNGRGSQFEQVSCSPSVYEAPVGDQPDLQENLLFKRNVLNCVCNCSTSVDKM